jgi:hypothetical protein
VCALIAEIAHSECSYRLLRHLQKFLRRRLYNDKRLAVKIDFTNVRRSISAYTHSERTAMIVFNRFLIE